MIANNGHKYVAFLYNIPYTGNHYAEIQRVDEIYDTYAAKRMGIDRVGQVCVMIHCGSRGLGHQVGLVMIKPLEHHLKWTKLC